MPIFEGISSQNIQQFLQDNDFDITQEWKKIVETYFKTEQTQQNALEKKHYPDEFLNVCKTLEDTIKNTFNLLTKKMLPNFSFDDVFRTQNLDQLISTILQNDEKLMVRSTGKEDTKELANAGGNESVSNVSPTPKNILQAIGTVVASYFGKKSLIQRLGAGDTSLFDPIPFTPVLLQRMIGEKDKQIPKCGVMFTEEAEGGIARRNIKTDDGKIKTTGITLIQAAYGHNEGVVNSLIPVDSFYVDQNNTIYPVIRQKTYRMSPANEGTLALQKNTAAFVNEPSLSKNELQTLKHFAQLLEQTYGSPMDVEFVIDEQTKTIYIVQARPIVHDPTLPQPSYIIDPGKISRGQKLIGSAIGVAGGALRYCANKNQCIVAETIGKALDIYQNHTADKNQIECIIVGAMAPSTSHEATAFRSEKKPVLYSEDINTAMQWHKENAKFVISPQQGLVINWQNNENSIEQLIQNNIATNGWVEYPIPRFISCNSTFRPILAFTSEIIQAFLPSKITPEQRKTYLDKPWKELLQLLKTGTVSEASLALATALTHIHESIITTAKQMHGNQELLDKIMLLQDYALLCATQIKNNLHYSQTDPEYMQRLLPIRFLESLLYQQPKLTEIVDGYSLATIVAKEMIPEVKITKELTEQGITVTPLTVQLMKIKEYALVPELEQSWETFVNQLAQIGSNVLKQAFVNLVTDLGKLELIPTWINTSFAAKIKTKQDTKQVATELIREFSSQTEFITQIFEKKEIINALSIDSFSDPKNFATQWSNFETNILNYFLSNEFTNSYNKANNLAKLAATSVMTQLVDTFDLSIKAVTGSTNPNYDVNKKVFNFHIMLKHYAQLFKTWITLVPEGAITYNRRKNLNGYIKLIDSQLNKQYFSSEDLKTTLNFSVSTFTVLNDEICWPGIIVFPKTLEEIFTTTHQSLSTILNILNTRAGTGNIHLPIFIKNIMNKIASLSLDTGYTAYPVNASLISLTFLNNLIIVQYNMLLRSHSVQFEIQGRKNSENAKLIIHFYGGNEVSRWDQIACLMRTLVDLKYLAVHINQIIISDSNLLFNLVINNKTDIDTLTQFIKHISEYSYNRSTKYIKPYLDFIYNNFSTDNKSCIIHLLEQHEYDVYALISNILSSQSSDPNTVTKALYVLFTLNDLAKNYKKSKLVIRQKRGIQIIQNLKKIITDKNLLQQNISTEEKEILNEILKT